MINTLIYLAGLIMLFYLIALPNFGGILTGKGYVFPVLVVLFVGCLHKIFQRFLIPLQSVPGRDRERVKSIISSVERKGVFTSITALGYLGLLSFAFLYMTGEIEKMGKEAHTCQIIYGSIQLIVIGFAGNLRRVIRQLMLQPDDKSITSNKELQQTASCNPAPQDS